MENTALRSAGITAVAPLAWGTTYLTTELLLPPGRPLFAAVVRALPAGLLLLAWRRTLPTGMWWWKALALGFGNIALFFPLLFVAAYRLPGGFASTIQAASPLVVMALAWLILRERPGIIRLGAGAVGTTGVSLLILRAPGTLDPIGLLGAAGSVVVSALGFVLIKRWPAPVDLLTLVSWQLVSGGLILLPVALAVEGAPPTIDLPAAAGFLWMAGIGTVAAYACWFHGLTHSPAGVVSLIGLLNPLVATLLGVAIGEAFGATQALGVGLVVAGVVAGQPAVAVALRRTFRLRRRSDPLARARWTLRSRRPGGNECR